ncbi:S1 RNA-binding domain-containing protein [Candidatus Woesearchaeota archaeon]|nr:S1 RNA-binding domain-containing protein [Candidatus Woesearchaeota archaeon]
MLLKKTGFPETSELLLCTVTSVQSHSVFVQIDEYGITGMIHISEVAPGRIRNIRDYVAEGKSIVCKVLKVNPERGHVDLSLRRVSESQKRNKINEIKKEKLAEKLVEIVAGNLSIETKNLYPAIYEKVREHFYLMFECFTEIAKGTFETSKLGLPKNVAEELKKVVNDRLKPEAIESICILKLTSYAPDGVEAIKNALKNAASTGAKIKYRGGGTYWLSVNAPTYKEAEAVMEKSANAALKYIKSKHGTGEIAETQA